MPSQLPNGSLRELVPGGKEIESAAETPEGVVMEQVLHGGDDITGVVCFSERSSAIGRSATVYRTAGGERASSSIAGAYVTVFAR